MTPSHNSAARMSAACVAAAFFSASILCAASAATHASRVIEYRPGPGQFLNLDLTLNPGAALGSPESSTDLTDEGVVSLGAFGGYIILGFDAPVTNDPHNPYGVDFTISGNTVDDSRGHSSCEPAAVMVMKDSNGNGIPDDGEWYELAGSDYWFDSTRRHTAITYTNPLYTNAHPITWTASSLGNGDRLSGALLTVGAHTQPYYPDPFTYPDTPTGALTLDGTMIKGSADRRNPNGVYSYRSPAFGYADSHTNNPTPSSPRNPYYADERGGVADGFDISWAVDREGRHVDLDRIDFIKIYTASAANLGWLGESSAEIDAVTVTEPDPSYTPDDYYLNYICVSQATVALGATASFPAKLFKNGRPQSDVVPVYTLSDPTVGSISSDGVFTPLKEGKTTLTVTTIDGVTPDEVEITVTSVNGVICTLGARPSAAAKTDCIVGEKILLPMESTDNFKDVTGSNAGDRYCFDTYSWHSTNPAVGTVDHNGLFTALSEGTTIISATSTTNPACYAEVQVTVKPVPAITLNRSRLEISSTNPSGNWPTSTLFRSTNRSTVEILSAESRSGIIPVSLQGNRVLYDCTSVTLPADSNGAADESPTVNDNLNLTVSHYGNTLTFTIPMVYTPDHVGIDTPEAAHASAPARWFTLSGMRLPAIPSQPGLYLRRSGNTTQKVVIR